jgi:hypothetical protein
MMAAEEFVGPPAPVLHTPVPEAAFAGPLPELQPPELLPTQPMLPPAPPPPEAVIAHPPLAHPPVAPLAYFTSPEMEERLHRLEQTLAQIKEIEQRLAARVAGEPATPEAPPVKSDASSLLSGAASLLEVGRLLLPAALAGPGQPPTPGSLADLLADLRAMYRMLVDPRYAMTWLGRLGIPGFLLLFMLTEYWMPATGAVKLLGNWALWLYTSIGQLITAFALFRVATYEARRYRETAPDLPPSLRL